MMCATNADVQSAVDSRSSLALLPNGLSTGRMYGGTWGRGNVSGLKNPGYLTVKRFVRSATRLMSTPASGGGLSSRMQARVRSYLSLRWLGDAPIRTIGTFEDSTRFDEGRGTFNGYRRGSSSFVRSHGWRRGGLQSDVLRDEASHPLLQYVVRH